MYTQWCNLCLGDLVMICESSPIKAKYKLAIVEAVHTSNIGCVRSATVRYSNIKGDLWTHICVKHSVQRLVLTIPVEEQNWPLQVKDFETHVIVSHTNVKVYLGMNIMRVHTSAKFLHELLMIFQWTVNCRETLRGYEHLHILLGPLHLGIIQCDI